MLDIWAGGQQCRQPVALLKQGRGIPVRTCSEGHTTAQTQSVKHNIGALATLYFGLQQHTFDMSDLSLIRTSSEYIS